MDTQSVARQLFNSADPLRSFLHPPAVTLFMRKLTTASTPTFSYWAPSRPKRGGANPGRPARRRRKSCVETTVTLFSFQVISADASSIASAPALKTTDFLVLQARRELHWPTIF